MNRRQNPERLLEAANQFIGQNRDTVNRRYRPRFHAVAPIGWINDPNGFFFDGEHYHLFYQHYPYEAKWNDMHWGHWRSGDLAVWEDLPVAMAPDKPYDEAGCFSGTALPDGRGGAHLLYTGVSEHGGLQQQCYAHFDGKEIRKSDRNPVIPFDLLPPGYVRKDFRDPKLFRTADGYRAVMAAKHCTGPQLVCFSSPDLENWRYEGVFCRTEGVMPECPDVFPVGGQMGVLYSKVDRNPRTAKRPRPVLYALGQLNPAGTAFSVGLWQQLDYGREFYAAQTCVGKDGKSVVVGWMASWETEYPTALLGHGWSGMMSLPRVLDASDGHITQAPAPGLLSLRGERRALDTALDGGRAVLENAGARHAEIHLRAEVDQADSVTLNVMEDRDERVSMTWQGDRLTLDRSALPYCQLLKLPPKITMPLKAREGKIDMTVYVDNCCVEIFAGGEVLSALAFPGAETYGVSVAAAGKAGVALECWQLAEN